MPATVEASLSRGARKDGEGAPPEIQAMGRNTDTPLSYLPSKMPFTPFHMGAGLLAKAVLDKRISLISFGMAQVLIDVEPGVSMLVGASNLHGWSHTIAGALCVGALTTAIAPWVIRRFVERWNVEVHHYHRPALCMTVCGWGPVALGAFVGTLSHLVLDAFIHADMHPLAPFAQSNPLLGMVAHDNVYALCALSAGVGMVCWLIRKLWSKR
jgi:hypothetical protein